jgi:hypothetical protein
VILIINVSVFFGLIILYTLIILKVRHHNHNKITKAQQQLDPRITKIMIAITLTFLVSYLPDNVLDANSAFNKDNLLPNTPAVLGSLPLIARTYFINNVINPIIYFVGDSKFRKTIKSVSLALFCRDAKAGGSIVMRSDTYKSTEPRPDYKSGSAPNDNHLC